MNKIICSTRHDYEYVRENDITGWREQWRQLLEGRFAVLGGDLVEDVNAPIFRLGFTVAEVSGAIGFAGCTQREFEWFESHPGRYQLTNDAWTEVDGWREVEAAQAKLDALNAALEEIDQRVEHEQSLPFEYAGNNYYMDRENIIGIAAALPILPAGYTQQWKTADKPDGINNTYVTLDKAGLSGLAAACLGAFTSRWANGDAEKRALKAKYLAEVG